MTSTAEQTGQLADEPGSVEAIAVIGLACRVPGAADADEFWENLVEGRESIKQGTLEEQAELGTPPDELNDPDFLPVSALLADPEYFDAGYFGMSAREAELRDPQQRLFLELAHTALENGGYDPAYYRGDIGVYAGSGEDAYQWRNTRRNAGAVKAAGVVGLAISSHPDYVATLASYKLNLHGPSFTLHTACSTSLVAIHLACEALRNGECDMALSGGVNMDLPLGRGYVYADGGVNSRDGHCRAFDARASGTVWGSGGAVVLLKRLRDALADGDHVRAVILGNAVNNDGADKVGFTAPSQDGQAAVIAQALSVAQVDPRTISCLEAHGTGTALGDPIEIAALSSAYREYSSDVGWCGIGSVKTNIGHLGPAAGVAGLVKVVLSLEHGLIPPSLNFQEPNPAIDFGSNPFYVNTALSKWNSDGSPRRAAVSSFGMGGTNAHVILEQAPAVPGTPDDAGRAHLLQLSARTPSALDTEKEHLTEYLRTAAGDGAIALADVSRTLRTGRRELKERLAVVATSLEDAAEALTDRRRLLKGSTRIPPQVALMFPGQGSQYAGMGAGLYRAEPVFRENVDQCAEIIRAETGLEIRDVVFSIDDASEQRLTATQLTQPALFAVEYALAQLWQSWGVIPAAMLGHSIGEYVAAALAGVFTLPDALHVVALRGRLMQALPPGLMLAVQLSEGECREMLPNEVSVAALNGPNTCVVSGPVTAVEEFKLHLDQADIASRPLHGSHAFHSAMMEPILAEFRGIVSGITLHAPRIPFLSNVTGSWITSADACDPSYWARHVREPVRFADGVAALHDSGCLLVECGPGRQLSGLARLQSGTQAEAVPSLPRRGERTTDLQVLYTAAGKLWVAGVPLDRRSFGVPGCRVPLPTYPWERKKHWVEPETVDVAKTDKTADGTEKGIDRWYSVPAWRQQPVPGQKHSLDSCVLFGDEQAEPLAVSLRAAGYAVTRVTSGAEFGHDELGVYQIRPEVRDDYDRLLADLAPVLPTRIVHAWTLGGAGSRGPEGFAQAQERGFYSLLWLVQALAAAREEDADRIVLDVITAGTQDVTGSDLIRPEHATVQGLTKVAPQELPWLTARHIDLEPGIDGNGALSSQSASSLLTELEAEPVPAVALRQGRRWRREFEPVDMPEGLAGLRAGPGLVDQGVYLITGGLGGIGLTIAEDLARYNRARLVLISRSGLPPRAEWDAITQSGTDSRVSRAVAAVRRMEELGAEVTVLSADVTSAADLRRVREAALTRFECLNGIIHAAGVPGGGVVEVKNRISAEAVLAPKVRGLMSLEEVFGDLEVDFVALFSSMTAVLGGFGQSDYCAANSFLDAYARGTHPWHGPVVSINWGGWREVGMAAEVVAPATFRALQQGRADTTTAVGHPLVQARHYTDDGDTAWFSGVISPQTHWVLDDHRINGLPVLPGTALLETVRCAGSEMFPAPGGVLQVRDVAFTEPLVIPDGTSATLRVLFTQGTDGLDFEVTSVASGQNQVRGHARGTVSYANAEPSPPAEVGAIVARCSREVKEAGEARDSAFGLITFGPRWRSLKRVHLGTGEEIALFEAAGETRDDLDRWGLHPGLLDEALTFGRTPVGHRYLPLGYGQVTIVKPIPARFWSHLRFHDTPGVEIVVADALLLDEDGNQVASVSDFMMRRTDQQAVLNSMARDAAGALGEQSSADQSHVGSRARAEAGGGIRPADGAQAFRRLTAADLGPQVTVSVQQPWEAEPQQAMQDLIADSLGSDLRSQRDVAAVDGSHVAPRTDLEAVIAQIWTEVLGGDRVSVTENFFDLGGNSLVAIQVISMVRKETGLRLPMRLLFENPSVEGIAASIEEARTSGQAIGDPDDAAQPGTQEA